MDLRGRGDAAPTTRWGRVWLALAYAALMGGIAHLRVGGLSPPGLDQDDLWVGFLVKYSTLADLLTYHAPVPMGFVAALKVAHSLVDDPELSLQIVPFVCGLALIPLAGWVTTRLTRRWELGLVAAVLVTLHPYAAAFSVRVKQFTWDAATTLALLGVALPYLDPRERDRPWLVAGASATALAASFNAIFAGAALCHVRALMALANRQRSPSASRAVAAALCFDAFALWLYVVRIAQQSAPWIVTFWTRRGALPAKAPSLTEGVDWPWLLGAIRFAHNVWLPPGRWHSLTLLAPIGLVTLLVDRRQRWGGVALTAMGAGIAIAGLARLYPYGQVRIDYYFQPVLAVLGAVGAGGVLWLAQTTLLQLGAPPSVTSRGRKLASLALAGALLALSPRRATAYRVGSVTTEYKDLIAKMDSVVRPGDLVLVTPFSRWNLGYYTRRPLTADFRNPPQEHLFDFHLTDPRSRTMRNPSKELRRHDLPSRIVVVGLHMAPKLLERYRADFRRAGWILANETVSPDQANAVQVWRRGRSGP